MRLTIVAIGRMKAGPERELISRYQKRFSASGRNLGFSGPDIQEIAESRASSTNQRKDEEAAKILATVPSDAFLIALDEHGKPVSSSEFSNKIQQIQHDRHRDLAILIGGADGHGDRVLQRANLVISFGRMTWPHQFARLLLVEQLYRAMTILSGHPYHRE